MNFSTWGSQYPVLDIPFDHDVRAQPRGDWASLVLNEPFAIPFMVASASLCIHTAHTVLRYAMYRWKSPSDEADARNGPTLRPVDPTTAYYLFEQRKDKNGNSIFGYTLARLFGCLTLSILSTKTLLTCSTLREHGTLSLRHIFSRCPEAFITVSLLYCLILALISMTGTKWATSARRHNIFILLSIMGVYLYRDIWPLATFDEDPKDSNDKLIWYKIATLTFTSVVVPLFIPRRYIPMDPKDPMPVPNDEQTCSIAALILYSFLDPVILLGYREKHMKPEQLPPLSDTDWTKNLVRHAFPHLDPYSGSKRRHLFFGLLRVFRKEYCFMGISIIAQVVLSFFSPIGVNRILRCVAGISRIWRNWSDYPPLVLDPLHIRWTDLEFYRVIFLATRSLARTEAIITQLVFEHSLRIRFIAETGQEGNKDQARNHDVTPTEPPVISPAEASNEEETAVPHDSGASAVSNETLTAGSTKGESKDDPKADAPKQSNLIGKLNNLVTTDLDNIVDSRDFLLPTLEAPLQIIASTVFLYTMLGWSAFVGIGLMVILLPVPGYAAKLQDKVQGERMEKTDARVQDITEVLGFIRMIKLFGWEEKMSKKIKEKRDEELSAIWRYKILEMVASVAGSLIPYVIMIATFATFTLFMKQSLTASIIFPSVTVFSMIRLQLGTFTWQVSTSIQGKVSLDRLSDFLSTTELLDSFGDDGPAATTTVPDNRKQEIGFKNTVFSWRVESEDGTLTPSRRSYRLRIDELFFKPNCINLIVGPTGSGKTSILMALLGEMHCIHPQADSWFNLPREGGVAYAAQESWVQNTTIRDNILFGSIYNEERYRKVIQQCALERDLELFEAGDSTEVGEKGVTLSGGQKARITLARAIYSPAQILLLDDILAALDVHTSAWIVNQCLRGDLVKGRTVLLVTHNVALAAPIAGFIVSLSSDGTVKTQGSDSETILANDPTFVEEMEHNLEEIKVADEEVPALAPKETSGAGKLIIAEEIVEGHVTWKPIKLFLTALGGQHPVLFFVPLLVSLVVSIGMWTSQSWFLGYWGSQYETHDPAEVNVSRYLSLYSAIVLGTLILDYGSHIFYIYGTMRASRTINAVLVDSVLSSTLRWLDETPISRIIARCTRDIRAIDGPLAQGFFNLVSMALAMVNNLAVIFIFTPVFLFPGLGVAGAGLFLGNMYLKAQLSVKRETSNARAPVIAHFGTAMSGIVSVRAYGAQTPFKTELLKRLDYYLRVSKMSYNLNRWIGIRIDLIGNLFTAALATYLVYGTFIGSSNTGFSLNLVVEFCSTILYWVRMFNDFEVQSNSLERVQGYLDIEHEPKPTEEGKPPAAWPTSGDIVVDNLTARYSETGPAVLHGLSFHIKSGERVGVVGRTGSGKSSLTLALLRCILTEGTVYYDGIPTNKVNLDALRSNITIIPQTPELISGTLRRNLDPFEQYDDAVLNDALRSAGLFAVHNEEHDGRITLDSSISSGGGNLSVGEKQIIALARAMVRGSKLLILDEATSAIDYKTDSVIQTTLRHKLDAGVTVVTVAHRLQTIMDADKIMVLDSGRIAEFDSPRALLQKADGMFRALVDGSGDKEALYDMASNATKPVASSS